MERLCKEDRKELVWGMRKALMEQVGSAVLTESASVSAKNFILNEATYEQLLNLCFNSNREEKYLPASVLEQVAVEVYEQYVEEKFDETNPNSPLGQAEARDKAKRKAVRKAREVKDKAAGYFTQAKDKGVKALRTGRDATVKAGKGVWATKTGKVATIGIPTLAVGGTVARKIYKKQKAKKSA